MKKARLIAALLAASFIAGSASIQAQEGQAKVGRVKRQFNESLDRFNRCIRGKCTRWEALKAARDLAIVAAAVITAVYAGKRVVEKGTEVMRSRRGEAPATGAEMEPGAFRGPKAPEVSEGVFPGEAADQPPVAVIERLRKAKQDWVGKHVRLKYPSAIASSVDDEVWEITEVDLRPPFVRQYMSQGPSDPNWRIQFWVTRISPSVRSGGGGQPGAFVLFEEIKEIIRP